MLAFILFCGDLLYIWLYMVLLFRNAMFKLVFLNRLVTLCISGIWYVNVIHFAAYSFYINRTLSTPITEQVRQQESNTNCPIAKNNGFPLQMIHSLRNKIVRTQGTKNIPIQIQKNGIPYIRFIVTLYYHMYFIS